MTRREVEAPEDLVARARRGLASETEATALADAVDRDPVLRVAHDVGIDLDRVTGIRSGDEALVARAADAALARVRASGLTPESNAEVVRRPSVAPRRRRRVAVLAAAALLGATGVAAGMWAEGVPQRWFSRKADATPPQSTTLAGARVTAPKPPAAAPAPVDVPMPAVEPDTLPAPPPREHAATRPVDVTAAALFKNANGARRDGDFASAERLYSELIAKYPSSDEAGLARVSLGKLLLEHGDPSKAEREFGRYLEGGHGQLAEEALVSRAESLQKMGRADAERATWQRLLADYPHSVYAAEAKARLAALSH